MDNSVKVVLIGADLAGVRECPGIDILGSAETCDEGVSLAGSLGPEVVVTSLTLRDSDGLEVAERVSHLPGRPACAVISPWPSELMASLVLRLGAAFLVTRPGSAPVLANRIRLLGEARRFPQLTKPEDEFYALADDVLFTLGFPMNFAGYKYLREAIVRAAVDPDCLDAVTKELYPQVARKFGSTPERVERAIRIIIGYAWRNNRQGIMELIGPALNGRPTNSRLIASAAGQIASRSRRIAL